MPLKVHPVEVGLALALVLSIALTGCGPSAATKKAAEQQTSNLKALARAFGQYSGQHRGQLPPGEPELKEFVRSLTPEARDGKDADALFVSERDGKPYVILFGDLNGPPGPGGFPVCMYEQEGKNGKRIVASTVGATEEVDEARFKQLVPGK